MIDNLGLPDSGTYRAKTIPAIHPMQAVICTDKGLLAMVGIPIGFNHVAISFLPGYVNERQTYPLSDYLTFGFTF